MSGFRTPEIARAQMVFWDHRLEDALSDEHQARHLDFLLGWPVCLERSARTASTTRVLIWLRWSSGRLIVSCPRPALCIYHAMNRPRKALGAASAFGRRVVDSLFLNLVRQYVARTVLTNGPARFLGHTVQG